MEVAGWERVTGEKGNEAARNVNDENAQRTNERGFPKQTGILVSRDDSLFK
jgi:hypothetical protein